MTRSVYGGVEVQVLSNSGLIKDKSQVCTLYDLKMDSNAQFQVVLGRRLLGTILTVYIPTALLVCTLILLSTFLFISLGLPN